MSAMAAMMIKRKDAPSTISANQPVAGSGVAPSGLSVSHQHDCTTGKIPSASAKPGSTAAHAAAADVAS